MSKIHFLSIILITASLSACGFYAPHKASLNASVIANPNNAFAIALKKRLNPATTKSLVIQIGDEIQKKQATAFDKSGEIRSYALSLNVPLKVFSKEKKLLLTDNLTASLYLARIDATQADRLQINERYEQLRNTLVKKLLQKLKRLKV